MSESEVSAELQCLPQDTCTHPELTEWQDRLKFEYHYRCTACGKHIVIDTVANIEHDRLDLVKMIGLVFGEKWEKKFQQGGKA